MKKLSIYGFLFFFSSAIFTACLKDKGNYDYTDLPAFYIDTVGAQTSFQVYQSAGLVVINPNVVFDGDINDLEYKYLLYASSGQVDTLSTQKNLSTTISRLPGGYTIELEVKQKKNGIKAFMLYIVTVLPPLPSGWMVMYEKNGAPGKSEIDIIRSPLFITATPPATDTVYRDLYATWNNNQVLPGTPMSLWYGGVGVYVLTSTTGVALQRTDFKKLQNFNEWFTFPAPNPPSPQGMFTGIGNAPTLISNNSVYWSTSNSFVGKLSVVGDYSAAPFFYPQFGQYGGFYDQLNRRFLIAGQFTSNAATYPNANGSARFNLNNIGKDILFVERSAGVHSSPADAYKLAFFKDVSGNGRYVYVINTATPLTPDIAMLDLTTAPDIQNAIHYAAGNIGNTAFYATDTKVYSFNYSTAASTYSTPVVGFTAPAGEVITSMKLYKSFTSTALTNDSRHMLIATWNAGTNAGKIYYVNVDATSGVISAPVKSWTIDGKVGTMAFKTA